MTTIGKRQTDELPAQYQYAAETRSIEREVETTWPAIASVQRVIVRGLWYEPQTVMIDVIDGQGCQHSRARNAQDSLAEIVGFWQRASVGLMIQPDTPAMVQEYLQAVQS